VWPDPGGVIRFGEWNHLVTVFRDTRVWFYWNAVLVHTVSGLVNVLPVNTLVNVYLQLRNYNGDYNATWSEFSAARIITPGETETVLETVESDLIVMSTATVQSQLREVQGYLQNAGTVYFNGTLTATGGYRAIGANSVFVMTLGRDVFHVYRYVYASDESDAPTIIQLTVPPDLLATTDVAAPILLINVTDLQNGNVSSLQGVFEINGTVVIDGVVYTLVQDPVTGSFFLEPASEPVAPPVNVAPTAPADAGWIASFLIPIAIFALLALIWLCGGLYQSRTRYQIVPAL
jgi:hypothetical protein